MFVTPKRQLAEYNFGHIVVSFIEMNIPHKAIWDLHVVHSDIGDRNLYFAEADVLGPPERRMRFSFRVDDSQPGPPELTFSEVEWAELPQSR